MILTHVHRFNLITNWYLKDYFLAEQQTRKPIAMIASKQLKGYDEFKPKTHNKQAAPTKATIEPDHQDHPRFGYRHMPCIGR